MTLQQVYDAWLPTHEARVSKSTVDCYKAAFKYFDDLKYRTMCDIDVDDLQDCLDACPRARRTRENMKAVMGLLYKYAIPRHQATMNLAEYLHTGDNDKSTRPAFTAEQVELIRQQIGITPYADVVYVLIYTGFRPAELFALTKDIYKDGILYGGIKTEAGKDRAVPVSPKVLPIIDEHLATCDKFLFPRENGEQMSVAYFRDYCFYPVLAAADIQPIPTAEHPAYYTPYSCRHTFANLLKGASGSDVDKAKLIGHATYDTTKKLYQSAELEAMRRIIEEL
jgi:integrase